jgi:protein dithiol oxidoreductase (disulfide-forming)
MIRPLVLTPTLALLVCACGHASTSQQHNASQATQQARPAATQQVAPAAPAAETAATAQNETEQATAAQETAGAGADDDRAPPDRSDVSLEHLAALPADAVLPSGKWKPGVNYDALTPAQPTNVGPGKVEVVEVFWLGCPHCYALEPFVEAWLKNKPAYIEFVRVPVMWGPAHRAHARLFYTLQALNRSDLFEKAFDTIQQQHQPLIAQSDDETLKLQQGFAKENGISPEDYAKAYNSFSVNSNLQRAEQLTQRYQVQGVPLVVVDGKYTTDVAKAGGPQQLIQIVDDLAASEHHH